MIVLLDTGHGESTPGKRSPDGRLREFKYCREIANEVIRQLQAKGIRAERVVKDDSDMSLSARCKYVNQICTKEGSKNVLLISIHCNAAGNGSDWMNARGWSVFVSQNSSNNSKMLADMLFDAATVEGLKTRKPEPKQKYWVQSLAMCRDTNCPAVLTENLFQDNKEDVELMLSDEGRRAIINLHVDAITNYIKEIGK